MQRSVVMSPYQPRRVYTPLQSRLRASSSSHDLSYSSVHRSFSREQPLRPVQSPHNLRSVIVSQCPLPQ